MKYLFLFSFVFLSTSHSALYAEIWGTKLKDRIQTQIRPKSFNQWHHQEPASSLTIKKMRALAQDRKWKDLIEQFSKENFSNWNIEPTTIKSEAFHLRAQAYYFTKNGKESEIDCKAGLALNPKSELLLLTLADNYANNLKDEEQALTTYRKIIALTGKSNGWLPISTTLAIASILTDQVKTDDALAVLDQYADNKTMAPVWRIKILRAYGHAYAAHGKEMESLAKFREALLLETLK